MADIAASVLAKLRNKAKASGISYQQCLQLFVQEEFLRKLSKSGCEDNLILKGGLFIYTLTNFESRATIDVDFLLRAAAMKQKKSEGRDALHQSFPMLSFRKRSPLHRIWKKQSGTKRCSFSLCLPPAYGKLRRKCVRT